MHEAVAIRITEDVLMKQEPKDNNNKKTHIVKFLNVPSL